MPVKIEVPVTKIVKRFFLHPANLGPDGYVRGDSEVGRMIQSVLGFDPMEDMDSPVSGGDGPVNMDKLDVMELNITFPMRAEFLRPVHVVRIGTALKAAFEMSFMMFVSGRFMRSAVFLAAATDFLEAYDLADDDFDRDNFRRVMERKYRRRIDDMVQRLDERKRCKVEKEMGNAGFMVRIG